MVVTEKIAYCTKCGVGVRYISNDTTMGGTFHQCGPIASCDNATDKNIQKKQENSNNFIKDKIKYKKPLWKR